ncbi:RIP metalloprotease RseP [Chryseobacterium carnipullorum]|uniref:Zinc metalloprotease n=1 Tax=Chryseobacterium carnipullorum TaxID=1124835 RepID=A0A376ERL7_CHRCU|nr:RIP metalloprotease RseP [Chryseobacterium carnipullorum]AZA48023.1 RIP metalloprotease RseP [Chryseobacterium carnipullorum]AZA67339.1 RIP metalloprotease RseP [Chryseobacterium carnipullorum]STD13465.1 Regulator of sigma E protease [Chryseobacterium carnipullorum]
MELAIKIFQFILSISILVVLHELGHFLPAKWFKTRAEKFFLFFDPWFSLFSMKKINGKWQYKFISKNLPDTETIVVDGKEKEVPIDISKLSDNDWRKHPEQTKYGIGWLPFGGYVKIAGMIDESMDTEQMKKPAEPWEFRSKPAWQRLIIMLGGVTVNFFLAWIIFGSLSYFNGETSFDTTKVDTPMHYTNIAKAMGFEDGDKILKVDGKVQNNLDKLSLDILLSDQVTVLRNGKEVTFNTNDDGKALAFKDDNPRAFLTPRSLPIIDSIVNPKAAEAGLKIGDQIVSVNGQKINYYDELQGVVVKNSGKAINTEVLRAGTVHPLTLQVSKEGTLGIMSYKQMQKFASTQHFTFIESIGRGFTRSIESLTYQVKQFKLVFNKKVQGYKKVGGPLAIIKNMPVEKSKDGGVSINWSMFWSFTAMFSVWLAFLNLIPIPGLDGGHVLFTLWEVVTGKPVPQKVLENAQMIGVIFLLGLMLLIFGSDIFKALTGSL